MARRAQQAGVGRKLCSDQFVFVTSAVNSMSAGLPIWRWLRQRAKHSKHWTFRFRISNRVFTGLAEALRYPTPTTMTSSEPTHGLGTIQPPAAAAKSEESAEGATDGRVKKPKGSESGS